MGLYHERTAYQKTTRSILKFFDGSCVVFLVTLVLFDIYIRDETNNFFISLCAVLKIFDVSCIVFLSQLIV